MMRRSGMRRAPGGFRCYMLDRRGCAATVHDFAATSEHAAIAQAAALAGSASGAGGYELWSGGRLVRVGFGFGFARVRRAGQPG